MEDVKRLILNKAKERFDRFGYKKTTMDELSRDCRISKKTIYEHFADKEDLFLKLLYQESNQVRQRLFDGIAYIEDPKEKLTELIRTSMAFFNEDNFLTRLKKAEEEMFSVFSKTQYDCMIRCDVVSLVAQIIREGKEKGQFRDVDEQVVAYGGFQLFQAFSYMRTPELDAVQVEPGYYTEVLIDFIINALIKKE